MTLPRPVEKEILWGGALPEFPENIPPRTALETLTQAGVFERERKGAIDSLLIGEEITALQKRIEQLAESVQALSASDLSAEIAAVREAVTKASGLIDGLYESPVTPEINTFPREEQEKFAHILLTPLQSTSINPDILNQLDPQCVFIGDIIASAPHEKREPVREELNRVMEELNVDSFMRKYAEAHNLKDIISLRSAVNGIFEHLKHEIKDRAQSHRKSSNI